VHGKYRGIQNVYFVNFSGAANTNCPFTAGFNKFPQQVPVFFTYLFGIIEQRMFEILGQDNRCCNYRSGKATSSGLITAGLSKGAAILIFKAQCV
jgi:hypothetical protein